MEQRISVPAVITSLVAMLTCVAATVTGIFAIGSRYGSLLHELQTANVRLASIQSLAEQAQERVTDLYGRHLQLETRVEALEHTRQRSLR